MQILETISLILCVVIFVAVFAVLKYIAIKLANQQSHKCKNCGGNMKVVDFYVFPNSNVHHNIVWYECPNCERIEEIDYQYGVQ